MIDNLQCQIKKSISPEQEPLTVGETFLVTCTSSDFAAPENQNLVLTQISAPELSKYGFQVLDFKWTPPESIFQIKALSDVVGVHKIKSFQVNINDELKSLNLNPELQFEVKSLQDPQNPQKEPFGMGLVQLGPPPPEGLFVLSAILVTLILSVLVPVFKKRKAKKRWNTFLKDADLVLSPKDEFVKKIRPIRKSQLFWDDTQGNDQNTAELTQQYQTLEKVFFVYMGRYYQKPFFTTDKKAVLKWLLKNNQKTEKDLNIIKILKELERIGPSQIKTSDLKMLLNWIEGVI